MIKLKIFELSQESIARAGAKYTMREAQREANIAGGACSVIQQYAVDGKDWSLEECADTIHMSQVLEEIRVKAHYRKHPSGVRVELAQLQQTSLTARARLTSAEEAAERLEDTRQSCDEIKKRVADEVAKAEELVNASGFRILALKRDRSKLHISRGRLRGLAALSRLVAECLAMRPGDDAVDELQDELEPHMREKVRRDGVMDLQYEEVGGRVRWAPGFAVLFWSEHNASWRPRIEFFRSELEVAEQKPYKTVHVKRAGKINITVRNRLANLGLSKHVNALQAAHFTSMSHSLLCPLCSVLPTHKWIHATLDSLHAGQSYAQSKNHHYHDS
eukprot:SAG31_NODE_48_length_30945_cov_16.254263_35_plen_332_part_00